MLAVEAPAAGAPLVQIAIASVLAGGVSLVLLRLLSGHLSGRSTALSRAGDGAAAALGLPAWAALPTVVAGAGLAAGGFGVFWDISIHMSDGRDTGPLANPSHYLILAALYACFAGGVIAVALHARTTTPARRAVRLPGGMDAPVGGLLLFGCGAFALAGFPLDDAWHRMFGQDVTLWGPTHLVMINGAILAVPSLTALTLEGRRALAGDGEKRVRAPRTLAARLVALSLPAALLFSVSFWATEFDWGLAQYRLVWQPLLLAAAAGLALVCGRLLLGRGGALLTVVAFLVMRGFVHVGVELLGETAPSMPLFVVEALLVEAAFLLRTRGVRPLMCGVIAGLLCGTVGFGAEYLWSTIAMPIAWTPALVAEGLPTAIVAGTAGGTLGALLGLALRGQLPSARVRRTAAVLAGCALVVAGANALWTSSPSVRASVTIDESGIVTARFDPPVRDQHWLTVTAWQGGGIVVDPLREVAPGTWRSERPVPLDGSWKTMIRLQDGRSLVSLPLHLPADPAIPFAGVTRPARFEAPLVPDVEVMQTERRDYVPGWLWTPAALLVLACCALFVIAISRGLVRAAGTDPARSGRRRAPRPLRVLVRRWA